MNSADTASAKDRLLVALKLLRPGSLYAVAPQAAIAAAMTLLQRNPVTRLAWSRDGSGLSLDISGHPVHEVIVRLAEGELNVECECGSHSWCAHALTAVITLKKIVSPEFYSHLFFDEQYRALFTDTLLGVSPSVPDVRRPDSRLLIERRGQEISIRLCAGMIPIVRWDADATKNEKRFLDLMTNYTNRDKIFQCHADVLGADAPIVYRNGETELPMRFSPDSVRTALTMLDVSDDVVSVVKVLEAADPLDAVLLLDDGAFALAQYHFDVRAGRIEPIGNSRGWKFWDEVRIASAIVRLTSGHTEASTNRRFTMSMREFNELHIQLPMDDMAAWLVLAVDGDDEGIDARKMTGELHISSIGNDYQFILACRLNDGDGTHPLATQPFGLLTDREQWRLDAPMRAKKRMAVLIPACFDLLRCSTLKERNALLKEAFGGPDFRKRKISSNAKWFATAFQEGCSQTTRILHTDGHGWYSCESSGLEQARLLEIPYRMFGETAFSGAEEPGEMLVTPSTLMPRLHELQSKIGEAGFTLFFKGKSVRSVKWDVTIDATRSSIDWFELRPEVKCEGGEVTAAEFDEAMSAGGMYMKDGEFVMLDSETSAMLRILPTRGLSRSAKHAPARIPRLQILDWLHLRKNGVTVNLSAEDERIFASLASFVKLPVVPLPRDIDATLREYQIDGYNWLAFLYTHRFGACLADDMGLGKTIQAIALLAGLHEGMIASHTSERLPHLIVVPPTLLFNWENELSRFYPALRMTTYRGTGRIMDFSNADVVLTSYGIVQRDAEELARLRFHVLIFDEAQAVKNIQTDTTGACRGLKGIFSLTLTGTPVENHLGEYYSVMDISVPGLLGDYAVFRRGMNNTDGSFLQTLIRRTRPFLLRRSKQMIVSELPPKVETNIYLELTGRQKMLYTKTVEEVRATVEEAYRQKAAGQARIIALTAILRLRQLCLSPEILLPGRAEPSPKIDFLIEQLGELFDEGHSVLVFSQFTTYLDIVEKRLAESDLRYLRLDGSTVMSERKKLVTRFQQSDEPTAFLLSLKAGGKGLNLTRATYVFHLDPWWNPAVEDQASDRAHRIGQTAQVTITRLVMRHTIEEKMMELKKRKLSLYKALLEDAGSGGKTGISREDFDYLLS